MDKVDVKNGSENGSKIETLRFFAGTSNQQDLATTREVLDVLDCKGRPVCCFWVSRGTRFVAVGLCGLEKGRRWILGDDADFSVPQLNNPYLPTGITAEMESYSDEFEVRVQLESN